MLLATEPYHSTMLGKMFQPEEGIAPTLEEVAGMELCLAYKLSCADEEMSPLQVKSLSTAVLSRVDVDGLPRHDETIEKRSHCIDEPRTKIRENLPVED